MVFRHLTILAFLLTVMFSPQTPHPQGKPDFSKYEYCVTDDASFGLYKPKGWKVGTQKYSNGKMVFVRDPKTYPLRADFSGKHQPQARFGNLCRFIVEECHQADAEP